MSSTSLAAVPTALKLCSTPSDDARSIAGESAALRLGDSILKSGSHVKFRRLAPELRAFERAHRARIEVFAPWEEAATDFLEASARRDESAATLLAAVASLRLECAAFADESVSGFFASPARSEAALHRLGPAARAVRILEFVSILREHVLVPTVLDDELTAVELCANALLEEQSRLTLEEQTLEPVEERLAAPRSPWHSALRATRQLLQMPLNELPADRDPRRERRREG